MDIDESVQTGAAQKGSRLGRLNLFFVVVLTIIYAFAEASFIHDVHTLRIHNVMPESLLQAFAFQLCLFASFLGYVLSIRKWRNVRIGPVAWNPSTMHISLALMFLLLSLMMERDLAVAVYKTRPFGL